MRRKELRRFRDIVLGDHVLDRGCHRSRGNSVDAPKGEAEEAVTHPLLECRGKLLSELDGLILDHETADVEVIGTNVARGRGAVAVGDLPGGAGGFLERAGLFRIKDCVIGFAADRAGEFGGPDPKIGGSSIKVQLEGLARGANLHLAEVLGVVLLIFGRHITRLILRRTLLQKDMLLDMGLPTNSFGLTVLALLVDLVGYEVWTVGGRTELVFLEEVDIGFRSRTLVFGVMDKLDLAKLGCHGCGALTFEDLCFDLGDLDK